MLNFVKKRFVPDEFVIIDLLTVHGNRRDEQEDHGLRPRHPNESLEDHELGEGIEIDNALSGDSVEHPQEIQGNAYGNVVHDEDPEVTALGGHVAFVPDALEGANRRDNCTERTQEDIPCCYNVEKFRGDIFTFVFYF